MHAACHAMAGSKRGSEWPIADEVATKYKFVVVICPTVDSVLRPLRDP